MRGGDASVFMSRCSCVALGFLILTLADIRKKETILLFVDVDFVPGNATWPTPSGITEEQARTKCQLALTSSQLWTHCQDKQKADNFIENCITDIEVSQ